MKSNEITKVRLVVMIPKELHMKLQKTAERDGRSIVKLLCRAVASYNEADYFPTSRTKYSREMKRLVAEIPKDIHTMLKEKSIDEMISMGALVSRMIEIYDAGSDPVFSTNGSTSESIQHLFENTTPYMQHELNSVKKEMWRRWEKFSNNRGCDLQTAFELVMDGYLKSLEAADRHPDGPVMSAVSSPTINEKVDDEAAMIRIVKRMGPDDIDDIEIMSKKYGKSILDTVLDLLEDHLRDLQYAENEKPEAPAAFNSVKMPQPVVRS